MSARPRNNLGRMDVRLTIHGGPQAMLAVLDALIDQNADLIKQGVVPAEPIEAQKVSGLRFVDEPTWRDAAAVIVEGGRASSGSLAAWKAASYKVQGKPPTVLGLLDDGHVAVFNAASGALVDHPARTFGVRAPSRAHARNGVVGALGTGGDRVQERMIVTLADDRAYPVRVFGDAIAQHNAQQIRTRGLPGIYESGVVYQPEGSPELWWDAQEIINNGFDDCEGLAAYRAGELIAQGTPAQVWTRRIQPPDGSRSRRALFHALTKVNLPGGAVRYDDPSVRLGMPVPSWYRDHAAKLRAQGRSL